MAEEMKGLGALRDTPFKERHKLYREHICHPCPDEKALAMERVQWLIETYHFGPRKPRRILDVGCHDGFVSRQLAGFDEVEKIVGIEPGDHPFREALKWMRNHPDVFDKLAYFHGGFQDYVFDNKFDWVVCFEVIEHFLPDEILKIFDFCANHVKIGGSMFFCTPNISGPWGEVNPDIHHLKLYTMEELLAQLESLYMDDYDVLPYRYFKDCPHLMVEVRDRRERDENNTQGISGTDVIDLGDQPDPPVSPDPTGSGDVGLGEGLGSPGC